MISQQCFRGVAKRFRGVAKQWHGKLIAVSLCIGTDTAQSRDCVPAQPRASRAAVLAARLDGDFFDIDPFTEHTQFGSTVPVMQQLERLFTETALVQSPEDVASLACAIEQIVNANNTTGLVGTTTSAILLAYLRALHQAQQGGYIQITSQLLISQIRDLQQQVSPTTAIPHQNAPASIHTSCSDYSSCEVIDRYASSWDTLHPLILEPTALPSSMHMAYDITLAQAVANGEIPPILRFWSWTEPTVTLGVHQSVANEIYQDKAQERGFTIMRRITGGGTMIVRPQQSLTYSLYVPRHWLQGLTALETYQQCSWWIIRALHRLGINAQFAPLNDLIAPNGGKIGGGAAKIFSAHSTRRGTTLSTRSGTHSTTRSGTTPQTSSGCMLYHATLAYSITAEDFSTILRTSAEKLRDKTRNNRAVTSATKRVSPISEQTSWTYHDILHHLVQHATTLPGAQLTSLQEVATKVPQILERTRTLAQTQFENENWTCRM